MENLTYEAYKNELNETPTFLQLSEVIQSLSMAQTHNEVFSIISRAAKELTGAQGAAFILRDKDDQCYYTDEVSIAPLWKGQRFPMHYCISGWSMVHKQAAIIPDIYNDPRIPVDAYLPTYIKSLAMIPIRPAKPMGAIGTYWDKQHQATEQEIKVLTALANSTAIALENLQLLSDLKEANAALLTSLRAKDEFLSLASHQLRTPLAALKLQLQLTQKQILNSDAIAPGILSKAFDSSLQHIENLTGIIEELLDVSQIRLNRLEINPTEFDISEVVRKSVENHLDQLKTFGCEVTVDANEKIIGQWDKQRIEQIMNHLLSNISKHAPGHSGSVKVKSNGEKVSITVEDRGPGIPKDIQTKIFERFERAGSYTQTAGLGLGLYITKKLVEAHNGNLFLISREGMGTQFIIDLPLS